MNVIAMSPNNQLIAMLLMGIGAGMIFTRAYDAVQRHLAMKRIRRNVVAYAAANPPIPPTSGPEVTPDLTQSGQPASSVPSETRASWGRSDATPARSTLSLSPITRTVHVRTGTCFGFGCTPYDGALTDTWDDYGYPAALGYGAR